MLIVTSFAVWIIVVIAVVWLALSLLLAWENRRFALVRINQSVEIRRREHRTAVYLPCKGDDGDLAGNLEAFFRQQHPNFQLHLIVESKDDPAYAVIQRIRRRHTGVDSRVVVAGVATTDGQKVHNLRVATKSIDADVKVLAFADADIRPEPTWLQALTLTVCKNKKTTANTGYRWMLPARNSLVNLIVYSINAAIAGTMGSGRHFLIWGGSWSIRRTNFDRLGIRDEWRQTLSDDLVASQVIRDQRENIRFAPRCLCSTTFDMTCRGALEFMRRQYLIGRKYAGPLFWPGYWVLAATVTAWWTLSGIAVFQSGNIALLATIGLVSIYLINVAKALLRQSVFRRKNAHKYACHRRATWFDVFASPLVMTVNFAVMTWSLFGSRIWWRENHYHIFANGKIEKLNQQDEMPRQPSILLNPVTEAKPELTRHSLSKTSNIKPETGCRELQPGDQNELKEQAC